MYKTPILRELIQYSQNNSHPNKRHVDKLTEVLHKFPSKVQIGYKNLLHMSNDFQDYISASKKAMTPTPKKRNLSKVTSSRLLRNPSTEVTKTREAVSPETRSMAISLNRHRLENREYQVSVMPRPEVGNVVEHRNYCDCSISEVVFKQCAFGAVGEGKLFISCRVAASDYTILYEHNIFAVLSIGQLPKCYPTIKGGYLNLDFMGVSLFKPLQQTCRFLNSKLKAGNVLIQCEDGYKKSVVLLMAYLMKELRINYEWTYEIMKRARPYLNLNSEQEACLKKYDKTENKPRDLIY